MVSGGTLADYVPNHATSGQSYGFSVGAEHHDAMSHLLVSDTIINLEPAATGERRVVQIDLTQGGAANRDVTVNFNHGTTNLVEMITKPIFTSQSAGKRTRLLADIRDTFARVSYEVEP